MSTEELEIYVAFGQRRSDDPLHWFICVATKGSRQCTYYHVIGGPTQQTEYELKVHAGKSLDSRGISTKTLVGTVLATERKKILAAAQAAKIQRCQRWTVDVLGKLESKGLVDAGTTEKFTEQIEPSPYEEGGEDAGTTASSIE